MGSHAQLELLGHGRIGGQQIPAGCIFQSPKPGQSFVVSVQLAGRAEGRAQSHPGLQDAVQILQIGGVVGGQYGHNFFVCGYTGLVTQPLLCHGGNVAVAVLHQLISDGKIAAPLLDVIADSGKLGGGRFTILGRLRHRGKSGVLATLFQGAAAGLGSHGDHPHLAEQTFLAIPEVNDSGHNVLWHSVATVGLYPLLHHIPGGFCNPEATAGCIGKALHRLGIAVLLLLLLQSRGTGVSSLLSSKALLLPEQLLHTLDLGVEALDLGQLFLVLLHVSGLQSGIGRLQGLDTLIL